MDTTQWVAAVMSAVEKGLDLMDKHFAAVLGVAGTLIGAWLANRHALKTQERSLSHAERQQKYAQQSQLRTEVYMRACASSNRLLQGVFSLADPSADVSQLPHLMQDASADLAALNVPASEAVLEGAKAFHLSIFDLHGVLIVERQKMVVAVAMAETYRIESTAALARQNQYTEFLRQQNIGGRFDPEVNKRLMQQFDTAVAERDQHHQQQIEQSRVAYTESARLISLISAEVPELTRKSEDVFLAIRRDLGLDIDEEAFRRVSQEGMQKSMSQLELLRKVVAGDPS